MKNDSRAVTDTVGFVLVFSLIVSATGLVYVTGLDNINNARDKEATENVIRAYDIMHDNIKDVYESEAPSRETELKLVDSQLVLGDQTSIEVTVDDGTTIESMSAVVKPIEYTTRSDATIVYSNGGYYYESQTGGAVWVEEPKYTYRTDGSTISLFIPLISTQNTGDIVGLTGGTALVRSTSENQRVQSWTNESKTYNVTMTVTTSTIGRAKMWERYCVQQDDIVVTNRPPNSQTVECSWGSNIDRVVIKRHDIGLQLLD